MSNKPSKRSKIPIGSRPNKGLTHWLPGFAIFRNYSLSMLGTDMLAGFALSAILVPAGMAYAVAAGLPAIYGLYATIVPLVVYAILGPSRILVLGPDSTLAGLIAATILPMAASDDTRALSLAGMLAILAGVLCLVAGLAKFGFVTDLISKPIRYGYMNGIALTVLIGQFPKMLGFSATGDDIFQLSQSMGIFLAVGIALVAFVWRAWQPYDAVLGRVDGLKGYHDISRHPEAKQIPGLVLFRWDAPLFFANASIFHEHVLQAIGTAPTGTKWVVIAAEPVTDIDISAADMLEELDQDLRDESMSLCFAELKGPAKDRLKRYGLFDLFGDERFFRTIGQAVDRYLAKHPVEWKDWEDGPR